MTPAGKKILQKIEALDVEECLKLDEALAHRLETQWTTETLKARTTARRRKLVQSTIDRAIERRRYRT